MKKVKESDAAFVEEHETAHSVDEISAAVDQRRQLVYGRARVAICSQDVQDCRRKLPLPERVPHTLRGKQRRRKASPNRAQQEQELRWDPRCNEGHHNVQDQSSNRTGKESQGCFDGCEA